AQTASHIYPKETPFCPFRALSARSFHPYLETGRKQWNQSMPPTGRTPPGSNSIRSAPKEQQQGNASPICPTPSLSPFPSPGSSVTKATGMACSSPSRHGSVSEEISNPPTD